MGTGRIDWQNEEQGEAGIAFDVRTWVSPTSPPLGVEFGILRM